MKKVYIEVGHGGSDPGTTGGSIPEKDINLKFSLVFAEKLNGSGIHAILSRTVDVFRDLSDMSNEANSENVDLVIGIHADYAEDSTRSGAHVIRSIHNDNELGDLILSNVYPQNPNHVVWFKEGDDGRDYYHIIRETNAEAIILERGFVSNPSDMARMMNDEEIQREAEALARVIGEYLGVIPVVYEDFSKPIGERQHILVRIQDIEGYLENAQKELTTLRAKLSELDVKEKADQLRDAEFIEVTDESPHNTLWGIAQDVLGHGSEWQRLVELNPEIHPDLLEVGQKIRVK